MLCVAIVMLMWRKRYELYIARIFLLAGYFSFFSGQFNGHYFGIVNFYVFEHKGDAAGPQKAAVTTRVILHDNARQPAHLAVDKRFHFKQVVRIARIHAPLPRYAGVSRHEVPALASAYSSANLPTNGLRGPPGA